MIEKIYVKFLDREMASKQTLLSVGLVVILVVVAFYLLDPTLGGLLGRREGFESLGEASPGQMNNSGKEDEDEVKKNPHSEGFEEEDEEKLKEKFQNLSGYEGPAQFGSADAPAGCYPRDQLTPSELLPKDQNSTWAQQNPMGSGSLKGKNFLSAGALLGVNTVGQSLRNANWDLRSEPPNPQVSVSVFNNSTIEPDVNRRPLEIG